MKKRFVTVILALALIFGFVPFASGCGAWFGGGKREGELTIWWPGGSPNEIAALHRAAELYRAANPDVSFNIVAQQTSFFHQAYMMAVNGRNYPDIAFVDSVFVQQLAHEQVITNLSQFSPAIDTEIREQIIDSLWPVNLYNNHAYALPVSANVLTMTYNRSLLQRVYTATGRTWTGPPATLDELHYAMAVVTQYNALNGLTGNAAIVPYTIPAGLSHDSMSAMAFVSYVARMGGRIMSDDLRTVLLYSDQYREANLAAASIIQNMGQRGVPSLFAEDRFYQGNVAFIEMGPWAINRFELMSDEIGFAPVISLREGGSRQSTLGLFSMVSTADGVNEELAVDFMKFFLTNDEVMLLHNQPQNLMPVTKSAISNDFYSTGDVWPVFSEQLNHIAFRPGTPLWVWMEGEIADFVTRLIAGGSAGRDPIFLRSMHIAFQNRVNELYR